MQEITAFLIYKRDYQNTSQLLDFLTDDFGLIRVIAKGIKNKKTRPQEFFKMQITLSGNGNLKTLKSYEIIDSYRELSYENLLLLTYINEIIIKLVIDNPIKICDDYYYLLTRLSDDKLNNYWLIRIFENILLAKLGFGIDFENDICGVKINPNNYYYFNSYGFKLSKTRDIKGESLLKIAKDVMPNEKGLNDYKKINKLRIHNLLQGKPLKSRELFKNFLNK